jgi:hypothetical protein
MDGVLEYVVRWLVYYTGTNLEDEADMSRHALHPHVMPKLSAMKPPQPQRSCLVLPRQRLTRVDLFEYYRL